MNRLTPLIRTIAFTLLFALLAFPAMAYDYSIVDLGINYNGLLVPTDINDNSLVVGRYDAPDSMVIRAFLWDNGIAYDLGTMSGENAMAYGINANDQVVGMFEMNDALNTKHAFLWENGDMRDMGSLNHASTISQSVNDLGVAVGWTEISHTPFRWDGRMHELAPLGNYDSQAYDINNKGQIVGNSVNDDGYQRAVLWPSDDTINDLGTLGGNTSLAFAINESSQVVGWSETVSGYMHAFVWNNGIMNDLGGLNGGFASFAKDINDLGQIVGNTYFTDTFSRAILWQNGETIDLTALIDPESGWVLTNAVAINNKGEIVGTGYYKGDLSSYILTPTVVPEPVSYLLMMLGAGAMFLKRKFAP